MKLAELIKRLIILHNIHGDIEAAYEVYDKYEDKIYIPIDDIGAVESDDKLIVRLK